MRSRRPTKDLGLSTFFSIRIPSPASSTVSAVRHSREWTSTDAFRAAPSLTAGLIAASSAYRERFDRTFSLSSSTFSESEVSFARAITSNLVGGIGYFYGSSIVDRAFAQQWDDEDEFSSGAGKQGKPELTEPRGLFSGTPSRSFFPRGFYWFVSLFNHFAYVLNCLSDLGTKDSIFW